MLDEHPIDVMLKTPDLGAVKQFYGEMVGLDVLLLHRNRRSHRWTPVQRNRSFVVMPR